MERVRKTKRGSGKGKQRLHHEDTRRARKKPTPGSSTQPPPPLVFSRPGEGRPRTSLRHPRDGIRTVEKSTGKLKPSRGRCSGEKGRVIANNQPPKPPGPSPLSERNRDLSYIGGVYGCGGVWLSVRRNHGFNTSCFPSSDNYPPVELLTDTTRNVPVPYLQRVTGVSVGRRREV